MNYLHRPIMIVGEVWGREEARARAPFVGDSGKELRRMLDIAEVPAASCHLTNIFNLYPPGGKTENLLTKKRPSGDPVASTRPEFLHCVDSFKREILAVQPNIIVAAGAVANWFLTGGTSIAKDRGTLSHCTLVAPPDPPPYKVLPTYHPAAVLRNWTLRVTCIADLTKALRHSTERELCVPRRALLIEPTFKEVANFLSQLRHKRMVAFDIETKAGRITHISFAADPYFSICIPFFAADRPGGAYWPDAKTETAVWLLIREFLESPVPKLAQNGLYDIQYLDRVMGIRVRAFTDDTSILHHALYPELPKALGYLGSIYAEDMSWKHLRQKRRGMTETKRDE